MTISEYIDRNLPFYHIAKMENKESILRDGLLSSCSNTRNGICVFRECVQKDILMHKIVDTELHTFDVPNDTLFMLIKLEPSRHRINTSEVSKDPTGEDTVALYNYICKDRIPIHPSDIILEGISIGGYNGEQIQAEALDGYFRRPPEIVAGHE